MAVNTADAVDTIVEDCEIDRLERLMEQNESQSRRELPPMTLFAHTSSQEQPYSSFHQPQQFTLHRTLRDAHGAEYPLWAATAPTYDGSEGSTSAGLHHKVCRALESRWDVQKWDCLPQELLKATPYSLALFSRLDHFSHEIADRSTAHAALLEAVMERRRRTGIADGQEVRIGCTIRPTDIAGQLDQTIVEDRIMENVGGLMLIDIQAALDRVEWEKSLASEACKRAKEVVMRRRQEKKGQREMLVCGRVHLNHALDAALAIPTGGESEVRKAWRKRVARERKIQTRVSTGEEENLLDLVSKSANAEPAENTTKKMRKLAHKTEQDLARDMKRALHETPRSRHPPGVMSRFERKKTLRAKKQDLPSERVQFGSLPSLYTKALETDGREIEGERGDPASLLKRR